MLASEIVDMKLHRGGPGENGPVVALLGTESRGEISIRNEDLPSLLGGRLYLSLYTRDRPQGAARAQLVAR